MITERAWLNEGLTEYVAVGFDIDDGACGVPVEDPTDPRCDVHVRLHLHDGDNTAVILWPATTVRDIRLTYARSRSTSTA